ncbi:DEAD/DEAH box helicase [Rhizobium sp. 16-449-1b]|uniref:helicase-related protein n=1 Tax=Rhizobium sp. 16-449-1b TaxID=2819989 RepID=UPI001FFE0370|nr:DEAD/DEAH box helicase [Rhizobium sp. 16-449-1b]
MNMNVAPLAQSDAYAAFLVRKAILDPPTGLSEIPDLPEVLFPFQRDIVTWALKRGRAALFAGTGLGKSLMELAWGQAVSAATGGDILHFAPLAVAAQMVREADKFGIPARHVRSHDECGPGINITNYQKIEHFDLSKFAGVILDESSILKSESGHYRNELVAACHDIPFRLAATATPAPNDYMELGNHAEFLGIMSYSDMLATFFTHDGGETQKWRLKGHAENDFWRWMASWAVMLRKPSDLGYDDGAYQLPALHQVHHTVTAQVATTDLVGGRASTLQERIKARRDSVLERIAAAYYIVTGNVGDELAACGNQNTQSDASSAQKKTQNTGPSETLRGTEPTQKGEPSTCANIAKRTPTSSSEHQSSRKPSTLVDGSDTLPTKNIERTQKLPHADEIQSASAMDVSELNSGSVSRNMTPCSPNKEEDAQFAAKKAQTSEGIASTSITAMTQEPFEASSAAHATSALGSSKTALAGSIEQSNTCSKVVNEPWLIWCQLNSEQEALEKAFAGKCISVRGSMTEDQKEAGILAWLRGDKPIMISKPSIMGFGLNFQHCHQMVFVGLNDSFEQVYQAIRRCWRFGQQSEVTAHFIAAETEGAVVANLRRKEADADRMAAAMVLHTANITKQVINAGAREKASYDPKTPMQIPTWLTA